MWHSECLLCGRTEGRPALCFATPSRSGAGPQAELRDFTRRLIQLRRDHPVFRRITFLRGKELKGSGLPLFETPIPKRVAVEDNVADGVLAVESAGPVGDAYRQLAADVLDKLGAGVRA